MRKGEVLFIGHIGCNVECLMNNLNVVYVDIRNLIINLKYSTCKSASYKSCHTPALHFVVKAYLGVVHITGKRMHVSASYVTLSTHNADALSAVKSLFERSLNPAGPVGAEYVTVNGVCVKSVVKENYRVCALSVKAEHVNSLVKLADRVVNVRIVDRRTGLSISVLHFISSYVRNSVGRVSYHIAHLCRLELSERKD